MTTSVFDEDSFKAELIRRAVEVPAFRAALLADPKGTVERELGQPLPDEVSVEVVQESIDKVYLVLPLAVQEADAERVVDGTLADDDLDRIAGGTGAQMVDFRHDGALNRALNRRRR